MNKVDPAQWDVDQSGRERRSLDFLLKKVLPPLIIERLHDPELIKYIGKVFDVDQGKVRNKIFHVANKRYQLWTEQEILDIMALCVVLYNAYEPPVDPTDQ